MVGKERQLGFGEFECSFVKEQTRREPFLAEMEAVVPFSVLVSLLEPVYPQGGRPPYPLEVMLRIHVMRNWYSLSDEATENELIDAACIRRFTGIDPVSDDIPDATTILAFRYTVASPLHSPDHDRSPTPDPKR